MLVTGIFDIFTIAARKLSTTFPIYKFYTAGFSMPCRLNRDKNGDKVIIYIREDIPRKS